MTKPVAKQKPKAEPAKGRVGSHITPATPKANAPSGPEPRIGCSGWHYDGWIGPFYPPETKKKDLLQAYSGHFDTAEINNSFYRLPSIKAAEAWHDGVPDGFLFAWKGSRYITHLKRLKEPEESVQLLLTRTDALGDRLGPILFQLPPHMPRNVERLARFLDVLPERNGYTIEFRHPSWYAADVLRCLADHNVSLCLSDHHDAPAPVEVTASLVYLRLHGPRGDYAGHYPDATLRDWARRIAAWRRDGQRVFVYFDNDQKSAAPLDAMKLKAMLADNAALSRPA
jgi:uncharacterized protein YecE (DUF72 family)